jgi:hypothetical protein
MHWRRNWTSLRAIDRQRAQLPIIKNVYITKCMKNQRVTRARASLTPTYWLIAPLARKTDGVNQSPWPGLAEK